MVFKVLSLCDILLFQSRLYQLEPKSEMRLSLR